LKKQLINKNYLFTLAEYHENVYSGNITINPFRIANSTTAYSSGEIMIELIDGVHADLAYGKKSPIMIAKNTLSGNSRRIDFDISLSYFGFDRELMNLLNVNVAGDYVNFANLKTGIDNASKQDVFHDSAIHQKLVVCERLIGVVMKALTAIPKDSDNGSHFSLHSDAPHPGYYEFIINPQAQVFFLDYRDPLHYSNLQHVKLQEKEIFD
jgi:hypothetical protein